jgi:hypothetical protein
VATEYTEQTRPGIFLRPRDAMNDDCEEQPAWRTIEAGAQPWTRVNGAGQAWGMPSRRLLTDASQSFAVERLEMPRSRAWLRWTRWCAGNARVDTEADQADPTRDNASADPTRDISQTT